MSAPAAAPAAPVVTTPAAPVVPTPVAPVVPTPVLPVAPTPAAHRAAVDRNLAVGVLLGVVSAVCYTGTNLALRGGVRDGGFDWALWLTCMKSMPSALSAWVLLAVRAANGLPTLPSPRTCVLLMAVGLAVQAGGNLLFQVSLGRCGVALAVPTTFSTLILTGALLGRFWLGESVSARSAAAMGLLIASIGVLGQGARAASTALPPGPENVDPVLWVLGGVGLSAIAGVLYGGLGVVLRRTTRENIPIPATLALVSTMGFLGMGVPAAVRLGTGILDSTAREFGTMLLAGTLNAIAFFAITGALRRLSVVQVNLINATQAAMCALGGVLLFAEPLSGWLAAGTAMTIAGLALMDRRPPAASARD